MFSMKFVAVFMFVLNFTFVSNSPVEINDIDSSDQDGVIRITYESILNEEVEESPMMTNPTLDQNTDNGLDEENDELIQDDEPPKESADSVTTTEKLLESTLEMVRTEEPLVTSTELTSHGFSNTTESITEKVTTVAIDTTTPDNDFVDLFYENTVEDAVAETESLSTESTSTTAATTESLTVEVTTKTSNETREEKNTVYVNKLSDQIRNVLAKYKESGNIIISDVPIPDPLNIPNMEKSFSVANMVFKNQTVYGLSNFTVEHINTDLEKMQVFVMLKMKRLVILGNYTMRSIFSRAAGPFNVTLIDVIAEGAAALHYTPDGKLEASETDMDMYFRDIKLDFKNLGFLGSFFQGVVGAVGSFIFEGIKPVILTEVNTNVRRDINEKIRIMSSGVKTNKSMNPVDQAVVEGRRYVRNQGYDPYLLTNYTRNLGLFEVNITEFSIKGLSRFYKVGEISLSMDNGTVEFGIHLATDRLSGSCLWSAGLTKTPIRKGASLFMIEHLQIRGIIRQSLDLTQSPKLHDLDFLLGNITFKTRREDSIDYLAELVVNNLPSLLRHIIVDGLEEPIKDRVQLLLNEVDMESVVDEQLPNLDNLGV